MEFYVNIDMREVTMVTANCEVRVRKDMSERDVRVQSLRSVTIFLV